MEIYESKIYWRVNTRVKFTGSCLEQPKNSYAHGKIVNIYIVYTLGASSSNTNHPTLKNCFLVQSKNVDINKYGCLS